MKNMLLLLMSRLVSELTVLFKMLFRLLMKRCIMVFRNDFIMVKCSLLVINFQVFLICHCCHQRCVRCLFTSALKVQLFFCWCLLNVANEYGTFLAWWSAVVDFMIQNQMVMLMLLHTSAYFAPLTLSVNFALPYKFSLSSLCWNT